ncbi:MAG: hypothetical protein ABIZ56_11260 [Chthoniobacteraceae bacterium]
MANYRTLYCRHCRQEHSFRKPSVEHGENLALSIITAGLYLIPWAVACYRRMRSPWRCRVCSRSYRPEETQPVESETVSV